MAEPISLFSILRLTLPAKRLRLPGQVFHSHSLPSCNSGPGFDRDLISIGTSFDLIRIADKPGAVVMNAAPDANPLTGQAIAAMAGYGVEAYPVVIHQRIEHVHAFTSGLSASESSPRGKAAAEINKLYEWIHGVMNLGEK